ncbi:MAG: hypothetical protein WD824_26760 [Cyclobacteriaceae bacterium]
MMRIFVALCLIALVLSCAHKDAGKGLIKSTGRSNSPEKEDLKNPESSSDSTFFVGYVDYFPETREFYTSVFYKEGHEYPDEELLESKLDSVIILDDDWGRERLPIEEARKLLVLAGLDTISIYTRSHQLVCRSPLVRVEYLWNGLENYFIAVFQSDGKFFEQTEELYGISSNYSPMHPSPFSAEEINDTHLNDYLVKKLKINKHLEWDMRHYKIAPPETTLSIISYYSMTTSETSSYLTSLENNQVRILNKEEDNYHFLNILPLPIKMNGKPLLLISAGYPSSDVLWDYLAGFDGTSYEAIDYNRIHVKQIGAK